MLPQMHSRYFISFTHSQRDPMKQWSSPPFYTRENSSTKKLQNSPEATELWSKKTRIPRVCLIPEFVGFIMSCLPCWWEEGDPTRKRPAFTSLQVTDPFRGSPDRWRQPTWVLCLKFNIFSCKNTQQPLVGMGEGEHLSLSVWKVDNSSRSCMGAWHWHLGKVSARLPGTCLPDSLQIGIWLPSHGNDSQTAVLKTVSLGNYKSDRVFARKWLCQQKCMKNKITNFPIIQREALLIINNLSVFLRHRYLIL